VIRYNFSKFENIPPYYEQLFFPNSFGFERIDDKVDNRFADTDNKKRFDKEKKKKGESWKYRDKTVIYEANSNGYRAPEWSDVNWAESVVIFGCSCTAGIGLAEDETVSHQLSKLLNRPVINLGSGGSSMQFSFLNSLNIIEKNLPLPYAVVQNWTTMDRTVIFEPARVRNYGPWDQGEKFFYTYAKFESNLLITSKYIGLASRSLWERYTRYASVSFFPPTASATDSTFVPFKCDARDDLHPGASSAYKMAETIAELLTKQ
jgi:hypothetical protein